MSPQEVAEAIVLVIKRLGKWLLYALLGIALLAGIIRAIFEVNTFMDSKPKLVTELGGIELGEKFADFMFKNPGYVKKGNNKDHPDLQLYSKSNTYVTFNSEKIQEIIFICNESNEVHGITVNGIRCYDKGESVKEKYGKSLRVLCLKDKSDENYLSYRLYDAVEFGVRHRVIENSVRIFGVSSPTELQTQSNMAWGSCD